MCGIFAAFRYHKSKHAITDFIKATKVVSHRGPDHLGYAYDDVCFLGHTRLSIIDIDAHANQPFSYKDISIVYNGEIFNYIELRDELITLGYQFETTSDTEVVLKAFHAWRGECFAKFNGMWAMVIYDKKTQELIVSKDRFAQKPLFMMERDGAVYFASELQQFASLFSLEPDFELIRLFLKCGGYEARGKTFFKGVEIFPKAAYCRISFDGKYDAVRYWHYHHGKIERVNQHSFEKFEALLTDAIKIRLRSDVPYGVMLSGGVDSTIVAAYARDLDEPGKEIPAFTYSSGDKSDEVVFASSVANKLNMPLEVKKQDQHPESYVKRLKQLVKHLGRGHSSPAIVSIDYLYESVHEKNIKVAIDGQGADELLAGYKIYFPLVVCSFLLKGNFKQAWHCLKDYVRSGFLRSTVFYMNAAMPGYIKKIGRYLYGYERLFSRTSFHSAKTVFSLKEKPKKNKNALNRCLIWQHNVGLENLLFYGDIVAMNNSVENRSPFLDHRLVDFVFSHSEKIKLWNGINKYALKRLPVYHTFKKELDRKKIGFTSHIKDKTIDRMIDDLSQSPILDWPIFSKHLSQCIATKKIKLPKYQRFLFRLYQVHLWNEIFQT